MRIILKMNNNLSSGKVISVNDSVSQQSSSLNSNQTTAVNRNMNHNQINVRTMNHMSNQIVNQATHSQTSNKLDSKPVIERGASWSFNETRALLSLWGQDMVQRQLTNSKRTRHVWEKIAEKLNEIGYHRKPDQVRTRVFNMIAEYRRILKDSNPERRKKCTFFEALHRIYQAKDASAVRAALDNYEEDVHISEQIEFNNFDENQENYMSNLVDNLNSETSDLEDKEVFSYTMSPSHFNSLNTYGQIGHVQMNGFNHQIVHLNNGSRNRTPTSFLNSQSLNTSLNSNADQLNQTLINQAIAIQRFKQQSASQQNSQTNSLSGDHYSDNHSDNSRDQFSTNYTFTNSGLNSFEHSNDKLNKNNKRLMVDYSQQKRRKLNEQQINYDSYSTITDTTSMLIDKMFEYLANGTETMKEWIKLEEKRLEQDVMRKREEQAREERRQEKYLEVFVKMQDQMFEFLSKQQTRTVFNEVGNSNFINDLREEFDKVNKSFLNNDENTANETEFEYNQNVNKNDDQNECENNEIIVEENIQISSDVTKSDSIDSIETNNENTETIEQLNRCYEIDNIDQINHLNLKKAERSFDQSIQLTNIRPINSTIIQHSNQNSKSSLSRPIISKNSDKKHTHTNMSLLATNQTQQSKTNEEKAINYLDKTSSINQQIVDLDCTYANEIDDDCVANFNFSNIQHEEIVN